MRNVLFLKFADEKCFVQIRQSPHFMLTQIARWTCSQWVVWSYDIGLFYKSLFHKALAIRNST
jgi:hypothetical protein